MGRTRVRVLVGLYVGVAAVVLAAVVLVIRFGWIPPLVLSGSAVLLLVVAAVLLFFGLAVRKLKRRQRTWITLIGAARTAAAALACTHASAILGGYFTGHLLASLLHMQATYMAAQAWAAAVDLVGCGVLLGVALLVEHWCAIDEDDEERKKRGVGGAGGVGPTFPGAAPA
ncbi:MAG: DUF3180 family protein [Actinomycetaceae bacterium]|nr:DUF3180 family protein [Actinomycetaceae bacterium]